MTNEEFKLALYSLYNSYKNLQQKNMVGSASSTDENRIFIRENQYKNTKLFLKDYRTIIYNLSSSMADIAVDLDCHTLKELKSILDRYYERIGDDQPITRCISNRMRENASTFEYIGDLLQCLSILRSKPSCYSPYCDCNIDGSLEYSLIYFTYLEVPPSFKLSNKILKKYENDKSIRKYAHISNGYGSGKRSKEDICEIIGIKEKNYKKFLSAAIADLSVILWSGFKNDTNATKEYFDAVKVVAGIQDDNDYSF